MRCETFILFPRDMNAAAAPPVKLKITPVSHTWSSAASSDCISSKTWPQFRNMEKKEPLSSSSLFVFITNVTQDFALVFLCFVSLGEKKTFWLFNFRTFLFVDLCVFFFFMLRNLIGQLEDWHFRRSSLKTLFLSLGCRTVWKVPLSPLIGESVSYSGLLSARRSVILFCHVTSWMLHTLWLILKFIHEFKVCACIVEKKKKDVYTYMFVRHCCSCSWMKKNMCRIPRKKIIVLTPSVISELFVEDFFFFIFYFSAFSSVLFYILELFVSEMFIWSAQWCFCFATLNFISHEPLRWKNAAFKLLNSEI